MTWKVLLVPHDFSASANHATALARDEAKLHGAKLLLLHVIDLPAAYDAASVVIPEATGAPISVKDYAVTSAEKHLQDISARLAKDGVSATPFIRVGNPVDEINRFVTEEGCDLVVMGTHGRTGLQHLLVGSVAERVVRTSRVPVLTVRHPDHAK